MSKEELIREFTQKVEARYSQRTLKSAALFLAAAGSLPGGTRQPYPYGPHPIFAERGEGAYLFDVDGNRYIDFGNCFTAAVTGYAHPEVVKAMIEQTKKGTGFAHPMENRQILADMICGRFPSVDKVRFCCSGTEANLYALRIARGFTGKDKVLMAEGGYHGQYDPYVMGGGHAVSTGLPKSEQQDYLLVPFNDKEAAEKTIRENKDDLAAVIVEAVEGTSGVIEARDDYLKFLQEVTAKYNVLLIADEVITFRFGTGGAQELFDFRADLTTFAKNIGGLTPVGAIGGREDVMDVLVAKEGQPPVLAGGTFGGNPLTMVAGIATLKILTPEVIQRMNSLGESLKAGFRAVFKETGISGQASGAGSYSCFHFTPEEVINTRVLDKANAEWNAEKLSRLARISLMNRGIMWSSGGFSISTPMSEKDIEACLSALKDVLIEMKPLIEQVAPQLIG